MEYLLTIWLEIHVKIKSSSKLFCQCKNEQNFDTLLPNTNICPVCTGQPWALPTISYEPLFKSLLVGKVLNCEIQEISTFDRKSYFYPDLPMWYQITQLHRPTNINWSVSFFTDSEYSTEKTISIRDAHIENDTAKMIHDWWQALLDFNRSGTPLIEIVTNPDFNDPQEVSEFLKELQKRMIYNNISDAEMDKWQMRVDVNISIRKDINDPYWTRVELKNINSFWMVRRAIENEKSRQIQILENWWKIEQETRWRNDQEWKSYSMRSKENALDYRYFPEPDLPKLYLDKTILTKLNSYKLEIPHQVIKKFKSEFWFHKEYINSIIWDKNILDYFFEILQEVKEKTKYSEKEIAKTVAKRISGPISFYQKSNFISINKLKFGKKQFVNFIETCLNWELLDNQLKQVMEIMLQTGNQAQDIIEEKWFNKKQITDEEIINKIKNTLEKNTSIVEQYKNWKITVLWFLVWQVMKETEWKTNPQLVQTFIKEQLEKL